jgi:hypothetical protein
VPVRRTPASVAKEATHSRLGQVSRIRRRPSLLLRRQLPGADLSGV